jgi:hypothetical protein
VSFALEAGSPAWRAARAAAIGTALQHGRLAGDTALELLDPLGLPPGGWWEHLTGTRTAAFAVVLPRPGDPRGLRLPAGMACEGAFGWRTHEGSAWLLAQGTQDASGATAWVRVDLDQALPRSVDPAEADRGLREAIVRAAHIIDQRDDISDKPDRGGFADPPGLSPSAADGASDRERIDRIIDSWVAHGLPTDGVRRQLAVRGLRILLSVARARDVVDAQPLEDARPLEGAARSAVEAAYSSTVAAD